MEAAMKQPQLHDIYFPEKKEKSANLILQQSTDTGTGRRASARLASAPESAPDLL